MVGTGTLLGCAFASGDCFFETDEDGVIRFISGATSLLRYEADGQFTGRSWREVLADHTTALGRELDRLAPGQRAGPFRLAWSETARPDLLVALFRNPQDCRQVCWSVAKDNAVADLAADAFEDGAARADFDAEVERRMASDVTSVAALLDLRRSRVAAEQESALDRALETNAISGVRLAPHRYAFVVDDDKAGDLKDRIAGVLGVEQSSLDDALALQTLSGAHPALLRHALKLTIDRFTSGSQLEPAKLADLFEAQTRETEKRAAALQTRVRLRNFSLVYQPIIDLQSDQVHHCEALIRFREAESPFEVIKFAENTGFIHELDWATITEALSQLRANSNLVPIAVNLSAQSLNAERFVSEIVSAYKRTPAAADRLQLEITESSALVELDHANKQIQRLRAAGMKIALDDFGAGAASLSYLQRLEVDTVKIDAEYIRDLQSGGRSRPIVANIAQLCTSLGATTVGEGVETADVASIVRDLGVDYGQGWCFGRPQAAPPAAVRAKSPPAVNRAAPGRRARA